MVCTLSSVTLEKSKESIRFRWMELSTGDVCEELDKSEEWLCTDDIHTPGRELTGWSIDWGAAGWSIYTGEAERDSISGEMTTVSASGGWWVLDKIAERKRHHHHCWEVNMKDWGRNIGVHWGCEIMYYHCGSQWRKWMIPIGIARVNVFESSCAKEVVYRKGHHSHCWRTMKMKQWSVSLMWNNILGEFPYWHLFLLWT